MADSEQQYEWAQSYTFRASMIPSILLGALIGPFFVDMLVLAAENQMDKGENITPAIGWPSLINCLIGIPLGGGFAWLVVLGMNKQRLKWVRWANQRGWTYEAKPGPSFGDFLNNAGQLKDSSLYWHHGTRRDLLARRFGERGLMLLHSTGFTHVDLIHDSQSLKEKSPTSAYLLLDANSACPNMVIHPRQWADHMKLPNHLQTVNFESLEFNQEWTVRAEDPKAAYDRITQEVMEFLMKEKPKFLIEFVGGLLLIQYRVKEVESTSLFYTRIYDYIRLLKFTLAWSEIVPDDLLGAISLDPSLYTNVASLPKT